MQTVSVRTHRISRAWCVSAARRRQPGVYIRLSSSVVGGGLGVGDASSLSVDPRQAAGSSLGSSAAVAARAPPTGSGPYALGSVVVLGNGNPVPPMFVSGSVGGGPGSGSGGAPYVPSSGIGLAVRGGIGAALTAGQGATGSGGSNGFDVGVRPVSGGGVAGMPSTASVQDGSGASLPCKTPSPSVLSRSLPAPVNHFMTRHPSTGRAAGRAPFPCKHCAGVSVHAWGCQRTRGLSACVLGCL